MERFGKWLGDSLFDHGCVHTCGFNGLLPRNTLGRFLRSPQWLGRVHREMGMDKRHKATPGTRRPITTVYSELLRVPVDLICPNADQPRGEMDLDELKGLANSIQRSGLLQPVLVKEDSRDGASTFTLVAGHRRLEACKMLGWPEIPALAINGDGSDHAELALIENLQRQDLRPLDRGAWNPPPYGRQ